MFGAKLTSVCPVWLQLRRRGPETFDVSGLHDHDTGRGPTSLTMSNGKCFLVTNVQESFCLSRLGQSCTQVEQKNPDGWVYVLPTAHNSDLLMCASAFRWNCYCLVICFSSFIVFTLSSSAVIWWLVLPGLHERAGEWRWNWRARKWAGGCCKGN